MSTPTTFTRHGRHVVTVMNPAHARSLTLDQRAFCAVSIAHQVRTHREACNWIVDLGLAVDAADADALIYHAEERGDLLNV